MINVLLRCHFSLVLICLPQRHVVALVFIFFGLDNRVNSFVQTQRETFLGAESEVLSVLSRLMEKRPFKLYTRVGFDKIFLTRNFSERCTNEETQGG